jgi:DNA polymerase III subunit gamma/tau
MAVMHLALPRKWRPRAFEDLVGQEAVARTLANAVGAGRISHAYLFTGPRGVGKTSTARILAAALNCEKGPTVTPCGQCASCREITARGDSLDVLEMDGASNRKIENARELIETVRYAPQRDRYRIAIIDEVHMLTTEAFNALLKTLEEPPEHAVFILASTELHKIPATIISRCQRFGFRRLTVSEIIRQLARVAEAEKIELSPGAAALLAEGASGSLRDGLSLLDQAATLTSGHVAEDDCREILALVDRRLLESLYSAVVSGDRGAVVAILRRFEDSGTDPRHASREFLSFLHRLLLAAAGSQIDAAAEERDRLAALAAAAPYETLLRALALAIESDAATRRAEDPALVFEMGMLRLAELPRLARIEDVLANPPSPAPAAAPPAASPADGPRFVGLVPVGAAPAGPAAPPSEDPEVRFTRAVDRKSQFTGAYVAQADRISVSGDELVLRFPIDHAHIKEQIDNAKSLALMAEAAQEAYGRPLRLRLELGPPADGDLSSAAREVPRETLSRQRASTRAHEDPKVKTALELFRGEIVDVKEEK